jgi:aryl-alcohol dehydrogenase-like predicted oxidoreductase
MELRKLGNSALEVSVVGLGGNNFGGRLDLAATSRVVHKALDLGVTLIDTAESYNSGASEDLLGQVLGERRKHVVLATKFGWATDGSRSLAGASRGTVMQSVEGSLRRLRTDRIDLYQLHRPDPATPIEETLRALDDLVRQGKVRHIGCSNLTGAQVVEAQRTAQRHGLAHFISAQDQYSLLARGIERELMPAIAAHGIGLIPYFPLASGLLSGKFKRGAPLPPNTRMSHRRYSDRFVNDRNWRLVEELEAVARGRGHTLLELAFGWLLGKPPVPTVIAGASTPEQIEQNVRAAGWKLSAEELAEVDRITREER